MAYLSRDDFGRLKLLLKLSILSGAPDMRVFPSPPIYLNGYKASVVGVQSVKHGLKIIHMPLETANRRQHLDKVLPLSQPGPRCGVL